MPTRARPVEGGKDAIAPIGVLREQGRWRRMTGRGSGPEGRENARFPSDTIQTVSSEFFGQLTGDPALSRLQPAAAYLARGDDSSVSSIENLNHFIDAVASGSAGLNDGHGSEARCRAHRVGHGCGE